MADSRSVRPSLHRSTGASRATGRTRSMTMITIRKERPPDVDAREALLDRAFGDTRFAKSSERLREDRLPARRPRLRRGRKPSRVVGTVRLWNVGCRHRPPALLLGPLAVVRGLPWPRHRRGAGAAVRCAKRAGSATARCCWSATRPITSRFGFSAEKTGALWLPGPFERHRLLALELIARRARRRARADQRDRPAGAETRSRRPGRAGPSHLAGAPPAPARAPDVTHEMTVDAARDFRAASLPFVRLGGYHPDFIGARQMTNWPVHGSIDGPIVMIGFGSIGKGTLPLIERHFNYDKSALRGHRPRGQGPQAPRRARHPLHPRGGDQGQLPRSC